MTNNYYYVKQKYNQSKKGKTANKKHCKKYRRENKNKAIARNKLNWIFHKYSISNDDFICAICGKQPIEKHHENYDLWYSFIPLCRQCHHKIGVLDNEFI